MSDRLIVAVTRRLPAPCEERLENSYEIRWGNDSENLTSEQIIKLADGAVGIIVTPAEEISALTINKLPPSIKIISCFSVGFEHININAAKDRNITVTNTPGVLTDATAEIAMLLLLGASRRASEGERLIRSGGWTGWRPTQLLGSQLTGKTIGILGMGRIGTAVAKRAKSFGMSIAYHNRRPINTNRDLDAQYFSSAEAMLPHCEVLSLHAPLTEKTQGFLNKERIALLPDGAVVINSARGGLIEDNALIAALKSEKLAAAGLDVYQGEPALDPRYLELENAFLLPHLGSSTYETRVAMGMLAIDNLDATLSGRQPPHLVI